MNGFVLIYATHNSFKKKNVLQVVEIPIEIPIWTPL